MWSSKSKSTGKGKYQLILDDDGRLLIIDERRTIVWETDTERKLEETILPTNQIKIVGDSLISGSKLYEGFALKSHDYSYYLFLENTGRLLIFNSDHFHPDNVIWSTPKVQQKGNGSYFLTVNTNGTIGIYDGQSKPIWSAGLQFPLAKIQGKLTMQNDGNLVFFTEPDNKKIWESGSTRLTEAAKKAQPNLASDDQHPVNDNRPGMSYHPYDGHNPYNPPLTTINKPNSQLSQGSHNPYVAISKYPKFTQQIKSGNKGPITKTINGKSVVLNGDLLTKDLEQGKGLISSNGRYYAIMQEDGDFVVYESDSNKRIWATGVAKDKKGPYKLTMNPDGELSVYATGNWQIFTSGTKREGESGHQLLLADDGNLVILDSRNKKIWSSRGGKVTKVQHFHFRPELKIAGDILHRGKSLDSGHVLKARKYAYFAVMQDDGNFVVYVSDHFKPKNILWSTMTSGHGVGPYSVVMQEDGNLVVEDSHKEKLWSSNTAGKGDHLMIHNGGLVIYDKNHVSVWSTTPPKHL